MVMPRGLRGATTVVADDPTHIHDAVRELIDALVAANALDPDDILSAIFSATPDLRSLYPAAVARAAGWADVPMLCVAEMDVPGSLARCVRVILHVALDADRPPRHVYLHEARALRPDWAAAS
jgi:chorismate mutase